MLSVAFIMTIALSSVMAQQPHKAKERIGQAKRMRLLKVLDLKDNVADKFIVKYTQAERKIQDQRRTMDAISKEIRNNVDANISSSAYKPLTDKYISAQNELFELIKERNSEMKSILSEVEYAKFLAFENDFAKELQKMLLKKRNQDHD
jgi:hypothetical protein